MLLQRENIYILFGNKQTQPAGLVRRTRFDTLTASHSPRKTDSAPPARGECGPGRGRICTTGNMSRADKRRRINLEAAVRRPHLRRRAPYEFGKYNIQPRAPGFAP
ncbi:hypothetical protein EVAR_18647_1 [Eumeta japonica]|uniref:Uncharacterized protein n=1 Tax=Eumeta variegata TaxID=151549 RepID=A0A4C1U821_EUMVA|nr:hypothetical protein EVAR_18647_1 [Eumeta japonica]